VSSLHSKVEPDSLAENVKLAEVELVVPEGPDVIVVSGAVVSTVQVRLSAAPTLPAASVPRTSNVCWPSESPL
jgi:hypothetical protein